MDSIKNLIENTTLTLEEIQAQVGCGMRTVRNVWASYPAAFRKARKAGCYRRSKLGDKNPMLGKHSTEHHNYIGVVSDGKGYLMALKPDWYTGRNGSKHVFVHQLVVCKALGITAMPAGWVVHHCDENPHNNDFSNLVLMLNADHRRLHSALAGATTISKESTLKWVEAHGTPWREDIV